MNKFERLERLVGTSMVNSFKNEKILVVGCAGARWLCYRRFS